MPVRFILLVRSLVFHVAFYLALIVVLIVALPCFVLPRTALVGVAKAWARTEMVLLQVIVGARTEIRGAENIPAGGFIVAGKHQSFWETFVLFQLFGDAVYIYKRQLMWIPVFGWYLAKLGMVIVDRGRRSKALDQISAGARLLLDHDCQVMIFPEGTRTAPGAPPKYKHGVAHLYQMLNCPVVPVGLASGLYWPRRSFLRYPGTIILEVLKPIQPGLGIDEFARVLQDRIEDSSNRLLLESVKRDGPPLTSAARHRIAELNQTRAQ
jgi:1-acyl-sn-glycerol-3-phosphate acyltransferase